MLPGDVGFLLARCLQGPGKPVPGVGGRQARKNGRRLTWRKMMEVSVQYRCISSPPCNTTAEPACTAAFFLSLSHRRCLFRANSASGTLRVSFPRENEGLWRHEQIQTGRLAPPSCVYHLWSGPLCVWGGGRGTSINLW